MIPILKKYAELKSAEGSFPKAELFRRHNRKNLEWRILGSVCDLLKIAGLDHPFLAEEKDPPDFVTYREDNSLWSEVEITEVLEPGRKRNEEMNSGMEPVPGYIYPIPPPLKEPFLGLRHAVLEKVKKPYAPNCVLIVYFNIGNCAISYESDKFAPHLQEEVSKQPFDGVGNFKRVLVLSSDMTELVELIAEDRRS